MPTPIPDLFAQSILIREKRIAQARAVLNRPGSTSLVPLATMLLSVLGSYFLGVEQFEAPLWVKVFLIAGFTGTVVNALDAWTTRRRLDAAITLLQLQQDTRAS